ncbi:MAG TPA: Xaa-Pro peptidase family protein, partial [Ktedonobacteraceae bacterium]|nr:Xaa-Pro peptidase family protein [Ktedonobacteraceae bacterium]
MNQHALTALRAWMAAQGVDAFLVTQEQNRSYLSGWLCDDNEGAGMLLVGQQQQVLLTSTLYREIAEQEAVGWQIVVPEGREFAPALVELAKEHGWKRIGFESSAMTVAAFERLLAAGQDVFTLQSFEESYVSAMRQVKQPQEIDRLRRAIEITDQTFTHLCRWIEPGMTEKEIAWEISRYMVELGADGISFDPIVASGPHGSMPHAEPGQRRIERGELITIDMGARFQGYCADMTRTICLGEPKEPRMTEVFDAVLNAMRV